MIKFYNEKNRTFIRKYFNQDVLFKDCNINLEDFSGFRCFDNELCKIPQDQRGSAIEKMKRHYELQPLINKVFKRYESARKQNSQPFISDELQCLFHKLILEIARKVMSAHLYDSKKLMVNRKVIAARIMQFYSLRINKKDPEKILIYCHQTGRWENGKIPIHRLIIELIHYLGGSDSDSWSIGLEKSIVEILLRKIELVNHSKFNRNHYPFANSTLDTEKGIMVPHSPFFLATIGSEVSYNPNKKCPVFEEFLTEIFEEERTIQFLQEWFGYILSDSHKANAMLICDGSGSNGKSTLFNILSQLVGISNVSATVLSNFNKEFGLEPLIDMKLNLASENEVGSFQTGKLKAITAGESISINRKNKSEVTTILAVKLVYLVNQLPLLTDNSFGFERRLYILPFNRTFTPEEQDKELPQRLSDELEGILNWSIDGLKRLLENDFNFTLSNEMVKAKEAYFGVGNPIDKFVREKIVQQPNNRIISKNLIDEYHLWMTLKQYPYKGTDSPQVFWRLFEESAKLAKVDFEKRKSNGQLIVHDIGII